MADPITERYGPTWDRAGNVRTIPALSPEGFDELADAMASWGVENGRCNRLTYSDYLSMAYVDIAYRVAPRVVIYGNRPRGKDMRDTFKRYTQWLRDIATGKEERCAENQS